MKKTLSLLAKAFAIFIFLAAILALTFNCIVIISTEKKIDAAVDDKYRCILVLGAGVKPDGSPSHMLEDRIRTAVRLYEEGASSTILMSGDHRSDDYNEVGTMRDFAISLGVPEEAIICDGKGLSTYESVYRAKEVFGFDSFVIVTQTYHLSRALYIADALGADAIGVSASLRPYGGQLWYDFREAVARCKDLIFAIIKPEYK